jgi:preprotein translocase subunit SecB
MSTTNGGPQPQAAMPQIGVLAQYVKDFSFENPNAPRSLAPTGQQPSHQYPGQCRRRRR